MQDERPAKNVFAAGEVMAGNILGKGYLAGFGLTIGSVFGRIAGQGGGAPCRTLMLIKDGERQMTICNACRYCEGYCAVFPAMELRRDLHQSRPHLSRQSLLRLPRLLLRLPVRAAARVRREHSQAHGRAAHRYLSRVYLAGVLLRPL